MYAAIDSNSMAINSPKINVIGPQDALYYTDKYGDRNGKDESG